MMDFIVFTLNLIFRAVLSQALNDLEQLAMDYKSTNQEIAQTTNSLDVLETQITDFLTYAQDQKKAVEELIQGDINGAFNNIEANERRYEISCISHLDHSCSYVVLLQLKEQATPKFIV